jgi:hypothetical protein
MEWVDWAPVLAHLANETAAAADQAAGHVAGTEGNSSGQSVQELTTVQLLQVQQGVQLRLTVQILSTQGS